MMTFWQHWGLFKEAVLKRRRHVEYGLLSWDFANRYMYLMNDGALPYTKDD